MVTRGWFAEQYEGGPALFRFCEGHGNGALATHRVDFLTSGPFYYCRPCADEAQERGLTVWHLSELGADS